MSRLTILNDLTSQLKGLSPVITEATMRVNMFIDQEELMPYVGVIPGDEIVLILDGYDTRYKLDITLMVKTKEDDKPLEPIIANIKDLIRTIDLGSEVLNIDLIGTQAIDLNDEKATKFSTVGMLLELIYTINHGTPYPAIESRTLTEPMGVGHYKIFETLDSGSATIQPLGTNIYDSHTRAALAIPAGSGSISIGAVSNEMDQEDEAVYDDELIDNHMMEFSLRIHSGFVGEFGIVPQPFIDRSIVDNVTTLLWGKDTKTLGGNYYVHEIKDVLYNQTFENTFGASMNVVVSKIVEYT